MINRNIRSAGEPCRCIPVKPFLLKPVCKDYLWGGRRLKDDFAKGTGVTPLAETWECSTHPEGSSIVASGEFNGLPLAQVIREHPAFLGTHPPARGELPILMKLIDAKKDLSIQVHPSDAYAMEHENGLPGKSELWYILDAEPGAEILFGLQRKTDKESLRKSISDGTIRKYLQRVPVKRDELYYVEARTIHAVGAGVLLVEIQENSNLTYRLYDYGRVDRNGKARELHIDKALEAANLDSGTEPVQPPRVLKYRPGCAVEFLCRCPCFEVHRMLVHTEIHHTFVEYRADKSSFRVLLCIRGCGVIFMEDGGCLPFFKGDCIFFPADSMKVKIHGEAQFLDVRG